MNTTSESPAAEKHADIKAGITRRVVTIVISFVLIAVILFTAAGRLDWLWAWVYLGICVASVLVNAPIMLRSSPETIAERGRPEATKGWDKVVGGLWGVTTYIALPLVAGLDVRFGWARDLSISWHLAGAVVLSIGLGFSGWAMIANAYFSTAVRIQSERGHTVCDTGPYRFVRHPGYVGFILQSISVPFLLGSMWALIPGLTAAVLMAIRTLLEDRALQAELPGYGDYVQHVRFRLIPGLW
ncbi:MAG: isoprenylcysteine carboxylmethyltransferase family protein [Fidelibacterota bacterium]|nr:MAG: isoprenylcysteine carboxylmethyltransferase family protein [Candidatus Neomarinimicrobiota bacterium]